jgi:hypothetical protein
MNPAKLNKPIGTCPCPRRGCDLIAEVFRYRERPNQLQRRRAGKLYLKCASDGRIEADGDGMQTFILENATIWTDGQRPAGEAPAAGSPAAPAPAPKQRQQSVPAAEKPAAKARPDVWNL